MSRSALSAARAAAPAAVVVALGALLLAGCSPAERPLVRIGSQTVTVDDYMRAAQGAEAQYSGPPEFAKAQLLQDLVRRSMMLEMARHLGHDTTQVVRNSDRDNERRALAQAYFSRVAPQAQRVSEAEARALYEARKQEAEVSMIFTSSRESGLAALARLKSGEPFTQVAQSLSLPGVLPPDGSMGMIPPGALPDPLDGAVRNLPVGGVGGPYETREGWFLVKVTKRQPHEQGTWEATRAGMLDLERQRKQRAAFNRAYLDLKAEWHMQPAPGGSQLLFRLTSPVDPIKPTPEQLRRPLATYTGGAYTVQDAFDDMQDASMQRPPANLLPALEIWIEGQTMTRIAELEARRRHLNEEPEVAIPVRRKHEDLLLEGVYQLAVANVGGPTPELVQSVWEQMKSRFTRVTSVQVASVVLSDTSMIMKLVHEAQAHRALADAARAVDASLVVTDTTIHFPTTDPHWTAMIAVFNQLQPGAWYGPEQLPTGWRVIQMLDKTVEQQQLEDLPAATRVNINSSAAEMARDSRFQQFTDSLSGAFHPEVDRQLLAKLPWPVKPPLDVGQ